MTDQISGNRVLSRRACLRLVGGGMGIAAVAVLAACAPAAPTTGPAAAESVPT